MNQFLWVVGVLAIAYSAIPLFQPLSPAEAYEQMAFTADGTVKSALPSGITDCKQDPGNEACKDRMLQGTDCSESKDVCLVMVDQAKLSSEQRSQFEGLLSTANFPATEVGKRCQYHGRPEVWCLVLSPTKASAVYAQLQQFGEAAVNKKVRRFKVEGG